MKYPCPKSNSLWTLEAWGANLPRPVRAPEPSLLPGRPVRRRGRVRRGGALAGTTQLAQSGLRRASSTSTSTRPVLLGPSPRRDPERRTSGDRGRRARVNGRVEHRSSAPLAHAGSAPLPTPSRRAPRTGHAAPAPAQCNAPPRSRLPRPAPGPNLGAAAAPRRRLALSRNRRRGRAPSARGGSTPRAMSRQSSPGRESTRGAVHAGGAVPRPTLSAPHPGPKSLRASLRFRSGRALDGDGPRAAKGRARARRTQGIDPPQPRGSLPSPRPVLSPRLAPSSPVPLPRPLPAGDAGPDRADVSRAHHALKGTAAAEGAGQDSRLVRHRTGAHRDWGPLAPRNLHDTVPSRPDTAPLSRPGHQRIAGPDSVGPDWVDMSESTGRSGSKTETCSQSRKKLLQSLLDPDWNFVTPLHPLFDAHSFTRSCHVVGRGGN